VRYRAVKTFLIWAGLLVGAAPVLALADDDTDKIYDFLATYYNNLLLPIGTVLAGFVIMFGGIAYAASGGDPSKVQKAKEYIFGAISGLILLVGAALIVKTIVA